MWLVAPHLPHSVREQLDALGIEYTEIHEAQFRQVADRYGIALSDAAPTPSAPPPADTTTRKPPTRKGIVGKSRGFLLKEIPALWERQRDWVTRDQLIDAMEKQSWVSEKLDADGIVNPEARRNRIGNWIDWFSSHYYQRMHGLDTKFERTEIQGTWAYRPLGPDQPAS
jgi:hypothetical protein